MLAVQDPLADGPTIHAAATRALLEQHVTLDQVSPGRNCAALASVLSLELCSLWLLYKQACLAYLLVC